MNQSKLLVKSLVFSLETTLLSETEIETKSSYDFQVLDVKKASEKRIFKKMLAWKIY